jgi:peptide/nickel transport system substrate-binding protein
MQQFWKQVGANMEIEQGNQTTIVTRAFARRFQFTPWRIIDAADPDPQMYANFHTGSPLYLSFTMVVGERLMSVLPDLR